MSDDEYIAEMEIPASALELGTMMRTLSRREALQLLIHERTWHLDRRGDLQGLLAQSALLRKLRPKYASVFWNSAIWEVVAGRAQRQGAITDPFFAPLAEQSFSRAREFTKQAVELGIARPDNKGEYLKRQVALREARLGEKDVPVPPQQPWDAVAETERFIAAARPSEHDWATVFREATGPTQPDDFGLNELLAAEQYNRQVLDSRVAEERLDCPFALSEAVGRYNQAIRQEDKMSALSAIVVIQTGAPIQGLPPPAPKLPSFPSSLMRAP